MACGQLAAFAVDRGLARREAVGEKLLQTQRLDREAEAGMAGEGGGLAGEGEDAVLLGVVERLLAEPVAAEEDPFATRVVNREGELPIQPDRQALAPFLIALDQDLGVGMVAP